MSLVSKREWPTTMTRVEVPFLIREAKRSHPVVIKIDRRNYNMEEK